MDYSLRIYKNEYAELHLNFIRKAFNVNLETEKVIEIVGDHVHGKFLSLLSGHYVP